MGRPRKLKTAPEATPVDAPAGERKKVTITAPRMQTIIVGIEGTSAMMQARMSAKTQADLLDRFTADEEPVKKRAPRKARNVDADFRAAMHLDAKGRHGIPASAFRNGMISACRLIGFKMTLAKLAVFVLADTYDAVDGQPLVFLNGTPRPHTAAVRNANGRIDLRTRPRWEEWSATVRIEFDADLLSATDIVNLLHRMGRQIGLGEGRPDSTNSNGMDLGRFRIITTEE